MKLLRQFLVIIAISFLGEVLHEFLPLPVPASIYGLVLMLVFLMTGTLRLESVRDAGKFLIEIMPVMFIPAGVGLVTAWGELQSVLVPVLVITVVSTVAVMAVSGRVTQSVIRHDKKRRNEVTKQ
ncbi:MAG: CidA/LrgA family protein [Fusicatenibacter sp.]|nr:CidA/LrgA family protein [Fusicatenibacter sp.]